MNENAVKGFKEESPLRENTRDQEDWMVTSANHRERKSEEFGTAK
jgi:hypothetical protein